MSEPRTRYTMSAEYVGEAVADEDGYLNIGGLEIPVTWPTVMVYVRRMSDNAQTGEIILALHDGYVIEADEADTEGQCDECGDPGPVRLYNIGVLCSACATALAPRGRQS